MVNKITHEAKKSVLIIGFYLKPFTLSCCTMLLLSKSLVSMRRWHLKILKSAGKSKMTITTTVILQWFSLLTQGLAGDSIQQPPPPLPILCIFSFQPALSCPFPPPGSMSSLAFPILLPSTSNDMIFFTRSSSSFHKIKFLKQSLNEPRFLLLPYTSHIPLKLNRCVILVPND